MMQLRRWIRTALAVAGAILQRLCKPDKSCKAKGLEELALKMAGTSGRAVTPPVTGRHA